jgi:phosphate-selective porin OprO and OprP
VLFRRVRPTLAGSFGDRIQFQITPEFARAAPVLIDAVLRLELTPQLAVLVGRMRAPTSIDRLTSGARLLFLERGYPSQLLPNRDVGVQFVGTAASQAVDWNISLLSGARDGGSFSASTADDNVELAGRLFVRPWLAANDWRRGFGIGFGFTRGVQDSGQSPAGYTTTGVQRWFRYQNSVRMGGTVQRLAPQLSYYHGRFGLIAEFAVSSSQLLEIATDTRATIVNHGWQVAASWSLSGEPNGPAGIAPAHRFNLRAGTWGAWVAMARIGGLSIDSDAFPLFADNQLSARRIAGGSIGLQWFWSPQVKWLFNFDHNRFIGGVVGHRARRSETALMTRLQLVF